jgi:uncharacterized protein
MKNLLEFILIHIVNHPEDVVVQEQQNEDRVTLTIKVNQEDIGRVIGKGGSVIHSLRNICKIRAIKEGIHAEIIIAE